MSDAMKTSRRTPGARRLRPGKAAEGTSSDTLHFLPWLRRGIGLTLTNRDGAAGALPRSSPIPASIILAGEAEPVDAPLALRPADHAAAIEPGQIVRRFPSPNSAGADYGYFPLADVLAPDLPWLLTPAAADETAADPSGSTGRLRPWLVLVCVEEAVAQIVPAAPGRPAQLTAPVDQLPDLGESYAWAHVQSIAERSAVADELGASPGSVIARFVCPRRLQPNTTYRVALVNAFVAAGDQLQPAWTPGAPLARPLLAYDTWTFATGDAHSFEELCERLGPVGDPTVVFGLHTTDLTELGPVDPWPAGTTSVTVDYRGALWDTDVDPQILGPLADDFAQPLRGVLDRSELHPTIAPDDPDPIVAPPFYGAYAKNATGVPGFGWMSVLNLAPAPRMAAGLGAAVVRKNQERYMALAWQQVGALRETNRQLSLTRLQGETGATWKGRADRLDPLQQLTVVRSQLTFVRDPDGAAPRRAMHLSSFPDALASPAFSRAVRPGGVVARATARRGEHRLPWLASVGVVFGDPGLRRELHFAIPARPDGARPADSRHHGGNEEIPIDPTVMDDFGLDATARLATAAIAPIGAALTRLVARIPALTGHVPAGPDAPTRVVIGPTIEEALMWGLVDLAPELLLPGVEDFPNNSVRVVAANPAYISSFLAGANHEMIRELLWREFPADFTATTFRRFWDRRDRTITDIDPISDWPRTDGLDTLGSAGSDSVVLLIRGDLVRHYPNVRVLLIDPATGVGELPSFDGWIPPDVRFMGFDVGDSDAVTTPGSGWLIAFEELPTEPRFGLDQLAPGDQLPDLTSWDALAWEHLTGHEDATHLMIGDEFPSTSAPPEPDEATWGLNSAHMARATYQRPYRRTYAVEQLIGGA